MQKRKKPFILKLKKSSVKYRQANGPTAKKGEDRNSNGLERTTRQQVKNGNKMTALRFKKDFPDFSKRKKEKKRFKPEHQF